LGVSPASHVGSNPCLERSGALTLTMASVLTCAVGSLYPRSPCTFCRWTNKEITKFIAFFGACWVGGTLLAKKFVDKFGVRSFTTGSNLFAALGFSLWASKVDGSRLILGTGVTPHPPQFSVRPPTRLGFSQGDLTRCRTGSCDDVGARTQGRDNCTLAQGEQSGRVSNWNGRTPRHDWQSEGIHSHRGPPHLQRRLHLVQTHREVRRDALCCGSSNRGHGRALASNCPQLGAGGA
jgi:hypothetical protein